MKRRVQIHTDGSCNPNPGQGAWAFLVHFYDTKEEVEHSGTVSEITTNNRMELLAAIKGLEFLGNGEHDVDLFTDSEYLKQGGSEWMWRWSKKDFKKVKNPDLWRKIHALAQKHFITFFWVRGHSGSKLNVRVDWLANQARKGQKP